MRIVGLVIASVGLAAFGATPADAQSRDDEDDSLRPWPDYAPAAVDAPQLRHVEPQTRVYIDGAFARSTDLSGLPYVTGRGTNWRATAGGSLRFGRFQVDLELPAAQATTVDLETIPSIEGPAPPVPEDAHQTALSAGDGRAGVQWTDRLATGDLTLSGGMSLRVRVPTHTTTFRFHLVDGSLADYGMPYYFHIEPAALLGGSIGRFSFLTNQGALVLLGPDGDFQGIPIVVPTIYFWDAHYAVAAALSRLVALSVEINTVIQLNRVESVEFATVNDIRAVFVAPGVQFHAGDYRIDAVGRFGLTHGADLIGVIGYGGMQSFTLRASRTFR